MTIQVLICGGGNGATTAAAYIGTKPGYRVHVLTRQPQKWIDGMKVNGGLKVWCRKVGETELVPQIGKVEKVSDKPEEVVPGSDIIICGGPSMANPQYLKKIAPFITKNMMVGALYAQGAFDLALFDAFGGVERCKEMNLLVFGLLHIPWICKCFKYGEECKMLGPKKFLQVTCWPSTAENKKKIKEVIDPLFDIPVTEDPTFAPPNFLCETLVPSNQIIHPPRYYGIFKDWDGKKGYPAQSIPLLYAGLDDFSAEKLQEVSDELLMIKDALVKKFPTLDLHTVKDLGLRVIDQYGEDVKDCTNMRTIFNSNQGYVGCITPVLPHPTEKGMVIPNMGGRFCTEDIPFGLIILRDIADKVGVKVPWMDFYIRWYQKWMNKVYLLDDGTLNPETIPETGCPSRYGIKTAEELVKPYLPENQ